jgi:hypothetical protein
MLYGTRKTKGAQRFPSTDQSEKSKGRLYSVASGLLTYSIETQCSPNRESKK